MKSPRRRRASSSCAHDDRPVLTSGPMLSPASTRSKLLLAPALALFDKAFVTLAVVEDSRTCNDLAKTPDGVVDRFKPLQIDFDSAQRSRSNAKMHVTS